MPKLKINNPYKFKGKGEPVTMQQVTQNYIIAVVNSKYPEGIDSSYRRIFGRLIAKLDEGIEKDLDEIDIEIAELDLIKNALREAKLPALMAYNANILEDIIEKI